MLAAHRPFVCASSAVLRSLMGSCRRSAGPAGTVPATEAAASAASAGSLSASVASGVTTLAPLPLSRQRRSRPCDAAGRARAIGSARSARMPGHRRASRCGSVALPRDRYTVSYAGPARNQGRSPDIDIPPCRIRITLRTEPRCVTRTSTRIGLTRKKKTMAPCAHGRERRTGCGVPLHAGFRDAVAPRLERKRSQHRRRPGRGHAGRNSDVEDM